MLNFIGSGSAFNTELGNNSAFYKKDDQLVLLDCGSSTFKRIKELNLLEGINHVHVLITHTHADHVGSLADLVLYTFFSHGECGKKKISIYSQVYQDINLLLSINGCTVMKHYDIIRLPLFSFVEIGNTGIKVQCEPSQHVSEILSYSFNLFIDSKMIYYSGDTNTIDEHVLEKLHDDYYDYFYIDTCKADYEGNVHLSLSKLYQLVSYEERQYVWCMHLDTTSLAEEAKQLGFNVVENYKNESL